MEQRIAGAPCRPRVSAMRARRASPSTALLLAALGIYGVVVLRRAAAHPRAGDPHGARRRRGAVLGMVVRQGLTPVAVGIAVGRRRLVGGPRGCSGPCCSRSERPIPSPSSRSRCSWRSPRLRRLSARPPSRALADPVTALASASDDARNFRYAARSLRRARPSRGAVILTLAVCIGATTAVFSVVYARAVPAAAVRRSRPASALPRDVEGHAGSVSVGNWADVSGRTACSSISCRCQGRASTWPGSEHAGERHGSAGGSGLLRACSA